MSELEFARATLVLGCVAIIVSLVLVYIARNLLREAHVLLDRAIDTRAEVDIILREAERKIRQLEQADELSINRAVSLGLLD